MHDSKQMEPVILVGDQGQKAADMAAKGIPCIVFPTQAMADQWRGRLNAVNAMDGHKLRIGNYEVVMDMLQEHHKQLQALAISINDQLAPAGKPKQPEHANVTAWRLVEVLRGALESDAHRAAIEDRLMKGLQYV